MWDVWWTKWQWDRFFSEFFDFTLPILLHRRSPYSYIIRETNNMSVIGISSVLFSFTGKCRDRTLEEGHDRFLPHPFQVIAKWSELLKQ
jgi:hypothetical protein